jgi:hypothetical protein
MGTKSNAKKVEQLGMSQGKAGGKLYRLLLFYMAKKLGMDICFRCGKRIERLEEFSIDHKKAWLDVDVALFWDLENIAFSHRKCNGAAARKNLVGSPQNLKRFTVARDAPAGKAWCGGCRAYLETVKFDRNRRNPSGYASYCKTCRSSYG